MHIFLIFRLVLNLKIVWHLIIHNLHKMIWNTRVFFLFHFKFGHRKKYESYNSNANWIFSGFISFFYFRYFFLFIDRDFLFLLLFMCWTVLNCFFLLHKYLKILTAFIVHKSLQKTQYFFFQNSTVAICI